MALQATTLAKFQSPEHWLGLAETYGLRLVGALLILLVGLWLAKRLSNALNQVLTRTNTEATLRGFLRNVAYGAMVVVVILAALQSMGFAPASLFAVLGAAGLGIGLALKDSLTNMVAGVQLIVQRPFRAGDHIMAANMEGTVEQVRVFQTRLRTADNRLLILPNSMITAAAITNFTATLKRRLELAITLGHNDDLSRTRATLLEIAKGHPKVLREPEPLVLATGLAADNRLHLELRAWVKTPDVLQVRSDLAEAVRTGMNDLGAGLPPGPRDVNVHHHVVDGHPLGELLTQPAIDAGSTPPPKP